MTPADLVTDWRERAAMLDGHGANQAAATLRTAAQELEAVLRELADRLLTPSEAERVSGYSRRRLRELEAEGKLPNRGAKGAPRYRVADLPRKARADGSSHFDARGEVRAILGGGW